MKTRVFLGAIVLAATASLARAADPPKGAVNFPGVHVAWGNLILVKPDARPGR